VAAVRGHEIVDGVFDVLELKATTETLEAAALQRTRAGARHVLRHPDVSALASHTSLLTIARRFIGATAIPFRATLFVKTAASNWLVGWHQDTALPMRRKVDHSLWGPWTMKCGVLHAIAPASALATVVALRIQLDDSTATNGPLRVLPDTHSNGVLTQDEIRQRARVVPQMHCVASAGSVIAIRPLVVHASSKSMDGRPRRVLHVEYASSLSFGPGLDLAVG
jgi:Phytanoyl-CoA dioxygenase (PhyH)